ncbi:hypothetical protein HDU76_003454, partial [Blyttiomyces sp. JEL0837]
MAVLGNKLLFIKLGLGALIAALVAAVIALAVEFVKAKNSSSTSCPAPPIPPPNPTGSPLPVPGNLLWPRPQTFQANATSTSRVPVDLNTFALKFTGPVTKSDKVTKAFARMKANALNLGCPGTTIVGAFNAVNINLTVADEVTLFGADESYNLTIPMDGTQPILIEAANSVGAVWALETLGQLIQPNTVVPDGILPAICTNTTLAALTSFLSIVQQYNSYSQSSIE